MYNIACLIKIRFQILKNYIQYHLTKTPSLISIAILLPFILYILTQLMNSEDFSMISLNPNIIELVNTFSFISFQIVYYVCIIAAPIYIMLSKINYKSFEKYKHLNISYKRVCISNYVFFLMMIDILVVILFSNILLSTSSSLPSIFIFLFMMILTIDWVLIILCFIYQIITSLFTFFLKHINIMVIEMGIVLLCTFLMLNYIQNLEIETIISIPITVLWITSIITLCIIYVIYMKIPIDHLLMMKKDQSTSTILNTKDMTIFNNYKLMIFNARFIYIEYIITLIIFIIMCMNTEFNEYISYTFQLMLPIALISNGIIYSYQSWFDLQNKDILKKTLQIDFICSIVFLGIISTLLSYIIYHACYTNYILFSLITYIILNIIQIFTRLKYINDSKSPIIFLFVFGLLSCLSFWLLEMVI